MTFEQVVAHARNHPRTKMFAELKKMREAIQGSEIVMSKGEASNAAWVDYTLIDKKGKTLSRLTSVYHGLGGTNDFLTLE